MNVANDSTASVKRAMVTGAAGFIGSHLTERLLSDGYEVYAFDIAPLDGARNLAAVADHPALHYTRGDITSPDSIRGFYRDDADVLFHLASVVGIKNYVEDPLGLVDVVVLGTRYILELVAQHQTRLVFTSTSEVFGKNPAVPWDEGADRVLGPTSVHRWSYSSSKAVCEHMVYGAAERYGIPFTIIRPFNVYGPRQSPIFVVSQSVKKALAGEPPLLYDDGGMTRCYTYVDDIVEGLVRAATTDGAIGESFNLGNTVESTVREVIETILDVTDADTGYEVLDTQSHYGDKYEDIIRRIPSAEKAERLLAWRATVQLREGIERTVEWARSPMGYL